MPLHVPRDQGGDEAVTTTGGDASWRMTVIPYLQYLHRDQSSCDLYDDEEEEYIDRYHSKGELHHNLIGPLSYFSVVFN